MKRVRAAAGRGRAIAVWIVAPIWPDIATPEGQREAVFLYGLALLAAGFVAANLAPLALLVPGALLAALGLGFSLRRGG